MESRNDEPEIKLSNEPTTYQQKDTATQTVEVVKEAPEETVVKEIEVVEDAKQPTIEQAKDHEESTAETATEEITVIDVPTTQLALETKTSEAIVVVPEELTAEPASSVFSPISSIEEVILPVSSRRSTRVVAPTDSPLDEAQMVVIISDEPTANKQPSHTSSSSSSSSSSDGAANVNNGSPDVVIEIHTDPITRQPTIVVTPGASSRRSSVISRRPTQAPRKSIRPSRRATVEVPVPKFVARHPHLGRLVLKILRLLGVSDKDAMIKVVHWGLYEWK